VAELEQGERNFQRRLQTAREEGEARAMDEVMDDGEGPEDPEDHLPTFEAPRSFASGEEPPSADAISSRGTRLCLAAARAWDNIARVSPMRPAQIAAVLGMPEDDVDVGQWYEDQTKSLKVEAMAAFLSKKQQRSIRGAVVETLVKKDPGWFSRFMASSVVPAVEAARVHLSLAGAREAAGKLRAHLSCATFGLALRTRLRLSFDKLSLLRNMLSHEYNSVTGKWENRVLMERDVESGTVEMPKMAMARSIAARAKKLVLPFKLTQAGDGKCSQIDFLIMLEYVVRMERRPGGLLYGTAALAESKLDIFVSGDGFGLYKATGATQLVFKIRVAGYGCDGGTTFSNEPSKCYTVTLFQGSDKHIELTRHTPVLRAALRKAAKQGIVVGGTAYALHLLAGGDIPFINGSVCLSGHTSSIPCHLCDKDNSTCDMVPGNLRTFEYICHSAHLSAYWPWRPFVCPCCDTTFETEEQCAAEALPWGEGKGADARRQAHQRLHKGVRWKHVQVFPLHDEEAPVGAEETTVLCKCPVCILHLFLRQVDMGVHYCVREFCRNQASADRMTNWFVSKGMALVKGIRPRKPSGKHHDDKKLTMLGAHCPMVIDNWREMIELVLPAAEEHDRRPAVMEFWAALEALYHKVLHQVPDMDSPETRAEYAAEVQELATAYVLASRRATSDEVIRKCLYVHIIGHHLADQIRLFGVNVKSQSGQGLEHLNKQRKQWRLLFGNMRAVCQNGGNGRLSQNMFAGLVALVIHYIYPTGLTKTEIQTQRRRHL